MTWVKVCGIARRVDLDAAEEAGADAVGLVLAPGSPRRLTPTEAATLAGEATISTFLVTVDATPAELLDLATFVGATGVQPHGAHAAAAAAAAERAGLEVLRPVRAEAGMDLDCIPEGQVPLLDAPHPTLHGGTGRRVDPAVVDGIARRWVLAGGLGPGVVGEAIARLRPWGVDASSRLESAPGVKDPALIRAFVEEARSA